MEEKTEKLLKDSDSLLARCGASFENAISYIAECIKQGEGSAVYADGRIQLLCKNPERC